MGSACLFFSLMPSAAVLSDINQDLVDTFIAVRDIPSAVHRALSKIEFGRRSYKALRKLDSSALTRADAAARFIFLNRFCFNGLYRTNIKGQFNVPYAATGTGNLPDREELVAAARALKCAAIRCSDFATILKNVRKGDFVYLDPPYAVSNRRVFRQYDRSSFGTSDLSRLAESMHELDSKRIRFVASYAYCSEALDAFSKWPIKKVFTQRNISGFARHRRRAAELLVSNCNCRSLALNRGD